MNHLLNYFLVSLSSHPERHAVHEGGRAFTYAQLAARARRIARALPSAPASGIPLAAVYAPRGTTAYAAIVGALWSGRGYVPLNPRYPLLRTAAMLAQARPDAVIVAREVYGVLPELAALIDEPITIVFADGPPESPLASCRHQLVVVDPDRGMLIRRDSAAGADDIAYLLFTSGTTGEPKGVPIRHCNATAYLRSIANRYDLGPEDRVSQVFDLTFDLSVHDLFTCWSVGACLYPVPENALAAPTSFLRLHGLTKWFCVPSLAARMDRLRLLPPSALPTVRLSLFCGEPLPEFVARRWAEAAPNSIIENLYGPTETTIAFTAFRIGLHEAKGGARNGLVPIGWPLPGQRTAIVDDLGRRVATGVAGELCLAGSQVAGCYWNAPAQSAERFVHLPGEGNATWFRTGDLAVEGNDGCLHYLGRRDDQIKIRGFRVELLEIDYVLRHATGTLDALAFPCPSREAADGVVAVVSRNCVVDANEIVTRCRAHLPDFMVPRGVVFVDEIPRTANGKLDRRQLPVLLAAEARWQPRPDFPADPER